MNGDREAVLIGQGSVVRELQVQRLRTDVALEVSSRLWIYLGDDGLVGPVVDDIVDRWTSYPAEGRLPLVGPRGFASAYLAAVEHDAGGERWWQFCWRDAHGRPVVDESYPRRVWSHHAEWLRLIRLSTTTEVPDPLPGGPAGELVVERLRTEAAIEVAAEAADCLGQDVGKVAAVVADVVAGWLALPATERAWLALTGRGQFTERYMTGVLYEREDPDGEVYRAEFRPPDGEPVDVDAYLRAVWTDHAARVVGAW